MATREQSPTVSFADAVMSNVIQQEALVRLMIRKGVFSRGEIMSEIRAVQREMVTVEPARAKKN